MKPIEQLRLFDHRVEQLQSLRFVRNGINNSFSINFDRTRGMSMSATPHDEEDLRSYLLTFRRFVSPKEPVHLDRIYNICHQSITSEELRNHLVDARAKWKEAQKGGGIKVVHNERELTPTYVMDLWINGYYFHDDADKLEELKRIWPAPLARFLFMNMVVDATRQVFYVGHVVRVALRENLVSSA